ncbi:MAG: cytochrome P450, partial [Novosphingobium sp.]
MATQFAPTAPLSYRTSPPASAALEQWLRANPQARPVHDHPWDVSRSDIYVEDRWQPIFAAMRAQAPVNKVTGTPYGDYWNVTTMKAIQHVESLPELFSSSWEHGGITIGERP